jgi:hypothetical protein
MKPQSKKVLCLMDNHDNYDKIPCINPNLMYGIHYKYKKNPIYTLKVLFIGKKSFLTFP